MSYEEKPQAKLERLLAQLGQALWRQQQTLRGQVNYFDQPSLNDLYPLQGTPMNPVERYSPTQPQRLTPPPSPLGMPPVNHMQEAARRAQGLGQFQQAPDLQVNPAPQNRVFDPVGFVPPQLAQNHAEEIDPVAERKARISQQGQKAQRDYDESLQRRKHLTYIEPNESEWEQITQAFHQMPVNRYKDIRKKDEVREMLIAMKEKQPFENIAKPMDYLISHLNRSDLTLPILKDMFLNSLKRSIKSQINSPESEARKKRIVQEVTSILGYKPLMNSDPYIIIGEQAYGLDEAVQKAKDYLVYLKKYGKPLPPLPYPTTSPNLVPQEQWRSVYPDITQNYNQELEKMLKEVEPQFKNLEVVEKLNKAAEFILLNFNNNENTVDGFFVDRGYGGKITHLKPLSQNRLVIYKERCIRSLSGSAPFGQPDQFVIIPISDEVGCPAPRSVVIVGQNHVFWNERGPRVLSGVLRDGDIEISQPSYIIPNLVSQVNWSQMEQLSAVYEPINGKVIFAYATGSSTLNNEVLQWDADTQTHEPRGQGIQASSLGVWNRQVVHGDATGMPFIHSTQTSYNGSSIESYWKSKYVAHGGIGYLKRYRRLAIFAEGEGSADITVRWSILQRGAVYTQNSTVSIDSTTNAWDSGTWGSAQWSTAESSVFHLKNLGRGSAIKLEFLNTSSTQRPIIRQVTLEFELLGSNLG
jgi:hypothetical protein